MMQTETMCCAILNYRNYRNRILINLLLYQLRAENDYAISLEKLSNDVSYKMYNIYYF